MLSIYSIMSYINSIYVDYNIHTAIICQLYTNNSKIVLIMITDDQIKRLSNSYLDAIARGDQQLAYSLTDGALKDRISVTQLYIDVLAPAQIAIGEMWHLGKINVAEEHIATSITIATMERVRYELKPRVDLGVRVVLVVLEDERHSIGIRMLADFLLMDGWMVDVLIDPTPVSDLIEFIRTRRIDLLALSFTMADTQSKTRVVTDTLREQGLATKVLLGGRALDNGNKDLVALGVNGFAKDAVEGTKEARRLVGLQEEKIDLESHLIEIGKQIRFVRTRLKMTQKELADRSGLDRTYISMVENGKQNLTLGAMVKISSALEVPLASLVRRSLT